MVEECSVEMVAQWSWGGGIAQVCAKLLFNQTRPSNICKREPTQICSDITTVESKK